MKSIEIIQEGPLDFVKRVGAGIGGMTDPNSTFKTGYQQAAGAQQLDAYAKKTYPAWNQAIANFKQQGVPDPQLGPEMQDWATEYFGVAAPAFSGPVNAQSSMEYLKKLWAMKLSPRKAQAPAATTSTTPAATAPATTSTTPAATTPAATAPATTSTTPAATAPATTSTTPAATTTGTTPTAAPAATSTTPAATTTGTTPTPAPAAAPAPAAPAPAAPPIFKDPVAFKAEWDKFVASKPNYRLIADPALLSVLKNMWMRSGGMKAESVAAPAAAPAAAPVPTVGAIAFTDPKKLAYDFESYMEADGKIPPAMRGVLKDILLTALRTVESRQRKLNNIVKEAKSIQGQLQAIKKKQKL